MNEKGKGSKRNQEDTDGEEDTSEEGDMDEEEDTDEEEDEREMMTQRKKTSGKRVFPRPYLDRDLSNKHMEAHSIKNHHVLESHHELIDVFFDSDTLLMTKVKLNFDYRKGMFGALAMIKSIADEYEYAPIDQIEKIKILFLSAAGKTYLQYLHLWSLSYKKIELFDLWKKSSLLLRPEFDDKQYFVPDLIRFCWGSKNIIEKSVESIVSLKQGHSQNRAKYRRSSATKKMARE
ncbi:hypothetical protein G6F16_009268 [Rhizopus arrhizus]|nr:hypothetical protein G6F23_008282 [Rhizopus arrhizus]KAG0760062.1 hypothetical protein G6F24_008600 [Rhizopus arrhizus]KAG0786326.1 hypothetical protein G6F21_008668 [Rhizopus arrhizus]KAG0794200.1 hypothetical protein G6F22_005414 [Rhizopus arrhizus]KAG0810559.1 hypothetical protein G6F20_007865 [Rhizopus arrhizus]